LATSTGQKKFLHHGTIAFVRQGKRVLRGVSRVWNCSWAGTVTGKGPYLYPYVQEGRDRVGKKGRHQVGEGLAREGGHPSLKEKRMGELVERERSANFWKKNFNASL